MMHPVWIVALTLTVYWTIGLIIFILSRENETFAACWCAGLVYLLLYILFYPLRSMRAYSNSRLYYERHGISRLQYFFGKRVRDKR